MPFSLHPTPSAYRTLGLLQHHGSSLYSRANGKCSLHLHPKSTGLLVLAMRYPLVSDGFVAAERGFAEQGQNLALNVAALVQKAICRLLTDEACNVSSNQCGLDVLLAAKSAMSRLRSIAASQCCARAGADYGNMG
eukprot:2241950-Amphidinium_carterae.1